MKKLLLILILAFIALSLNAQVNFKSSKLSLTSDKGYRDWQLTEVYIHINIPKDKITVFSRKQQDYLIIEYPEPYIDQDGDKILIFACVDGEGVKCLIRVIHRKSGLEFYVNYKNVGWVYKIHTIN